MRVERLEALIYRCPIDVPVRTAFGTMRDRPMLLVRVQDADGAQGLGEIWCNFPSDAAEHRARLLAREIAPALIGRDFDGPGAARPFLESATRKLMLQAGEPGPFAQCLAGIDIALHDLAARRRGVPLAALLGATFGGAASDRVPVYASGIGPERPGERAGELAAAGYTAFKLKVGFGEPADIANVTAILDRIGTGSLAVDANQGWDLPQARHMADRLADFPLDWIEEPLAADRPAEEWRALAQVARHPLAGGENIVSALGFEQAIAEGVLGVLQPDAAKWGGVSGCADVARRALGAGRRYCPHYLGGAVGLMASAHLLAAVGGGGRLEVDSNPNPLRSLQLGRRLADPQKGLDLSRCIGIGLDPSLTEVAEFQVDALTMTGDGG